MSITDTTDQVPHRKAAPSAVATARHPLVGLSLEARILLVILGVLSVWGLAITSFGIPALVWPMKLIVPSMVLMLVLITWSE